MLRLPTVDYAGFLQISRTVLEGKQRTFYAELHGNFLYYWSEKPRTAESVPLSCVNLDGASFAEPAGSRLEVGVTGPHIPKPVIITFPLEREKNEWISKMSHRVAEHSRQMAVQENADAEEPKESTIFTVDGQKKISIDDFESLKVLGEGAFGRVHLVMKKDTGKKYAMKIMDKEKMQEQCTSQITAERSILEHLDHPFIVHLHYAFQTARSLFIVMDLLSGGELFYHLEQTGYFEESRAKFYTAEMGLAIGYLHSKNIIYRDLKPENVVLDGDGNACLTDFGLAKMNMGINSTAETFCGTPEYQAPEFLLGDPHSGAVDWWSLGIMLYEMIFGIPPFYDENSTVLSELILEGEMKFNENGRTVSPAARDLIVKLLQRDPKVRLHQVDEFKKHPFFADIDFEKLYRREIQPPFTPSTSTEDNFGAEFTQQAAIVERDGPSTDATHSNVANYTYCGDTVVPPAAVAPPPPAAAPLAPISPKSMSKKHSVDSMNSGSSSGSKLKPLSPTTKKGGGGTPPPHLVAKMVPKRPSSDKGCK